MKQIFALILILAPSIACPAQNTGKYTVNIHVISSYLDTDGFYGSNPLVAGMALKLDVLINGTKYELAGKPIRLSLAIPGLVVPGDYKARIVSEKQKGTYAFARSYEVLFPDQTTAKFGVISQTE